MALLDKVKVALRVTTTSYNDEITDLIAAAKLDLGLAGVELPDELDELCERAVITYCRLNFSFPNADRISGSYDRLKAAYDEQKSQLASATGYTEW